MRFEREARAASASATKHIVDVLDAGTDRATGRPFMVMQLLDGEDLAQLLMRAGPLRVDLALRIIAQACRGLAQAHAAGVIHRDIKPANLFLSYEGSEAVVKILDFGVAKVTNDSMCLGLTRTGTMIGSPHYMSPEQARGRSDSDHRSDLWSLGVVAYKLLSGRIPFAHVKGLGDLLVALCCETVPPLSAAAPWLRPEVATFVHRALVAEPAQRYQDADVMGAAARRLIRSERIAIDDLPPRVSADEDEIDTLPWLPTTRPPPTAFSLPPI